jgi:hypothetical protein
MGKYFLIIVLVFIFKVLPGYRKFKGGKKGIGYFDMLEGISFVIIMLLAYMIECIL